ncbi:MAG: hypothetical protein KJT01_06025 [Gemmatimonadetes bacterium]|nr:hypothetical protein [Gemmatimonadota bacterium]
MIDRLFPDVFLPRKLGPDARQRLRIAQARAEEALIATHVENALCFVETLAGEAGFERGLALYLQLLEVPEPLASVVMMRALVTLGDQLPDPRPLGRQEPVRETLREAEAVTEPARERALLPALRAANRRAS